MFVRGVGIRDVAEIEDKWTVRKDLERRHRFTQIFILLIINKL